MYGGVSEVKSVTISKLTCNKTTVQTGAQLVIDTTHFNKMTWGNFALAEGSGTPIATIQNHEGGIYPGRYTWPHTWNISSWSQVWISLDSPANARTEITDIVFE